MKTSKKLLSLFLAVVMAVSACSVGFTAFAADESTKVFQQPTGADATFEALNSAVNQLKIDGKSVSELVASLSPTLLNALGGSGSMSSILGENSITPFSDTYYKYLNNSDGGMNYWSLLGFTRNNLSNSDKATKDYSKETNDKIENFYKVYQNADSQATAAFNAAKKEIHRMFGFGNESEAIATFADTKDGDPAPRYLTISEFDDYSVSNADGSTTVALKEVGDSFNGIDLKPFKQYMSGILRKTNVQPKDGLEFTTAECCYYYFNDPHYTTGLYYYLILQSRDSVTLDFESVELGPKVTVTKNDDVFDKVFNELQFTDETIVELLLMLYGEDGLGVVDSNGDVVSDAAGIADAFGIPGTTPAEVAPYLKANFNSVLDSFLTMLIGLEGGFGANEFARSEYFYDMVCTVLVEGGVFANKEAIDAKRESAKATTDELDILVKLAKETYNSNDDSKNKREFVAALMPNINAPTGGKSPVEGVSDVTAWYVCYALNDNTLNFKNDIQGNSSNFRNMVLNNSLDYFNYSLACNYLYERSASGTTSVEWNPSTIYLNYVYDYLTFVKPVVDNSRVSYKWSVYKPTDEVAVRMVNTLLNNLLVDEKKGILNNKVVVGVLDNLLRTKVDLAKALDNVYLNLYTSPVETIAKLLPVLVVLIDEVLVPILFNAQGDLYYNEGNGLLLDLLTDKTITIGKVVKDLIGIDIESWTQDAESAVGIGSLRFDLNTLLPDLLHWLQGDTSYTYTYYDFTKYDADGAEISERSLIKVDKTNEKGEVEKDDDGNPVKKTIINPAIKRVVYRATTTGTYNKSKVPVITNIFCVDELLAGAEIADLHKLVEGDTGVIVEEVVAELAFFFTDSIDTYLDEHATDQRIGVDSSGPYPITTGANDILVALPQIIDRAGKDFVAKYGIDSDWGYGNIGQIDITNKNDTITDKLTVNETLEAFKANASDPDTSNILQGLISIITDNWLNALIDLLNSVVTTDNKISSELPIVAGLLNSLGGLGEQSILTDVLNGVFQLTRTDDCSFTLTQRGDGFLGQKNHYVGLSNDSGLFLIYNIVNLVDAIKGLVTSINNIPKSPSSDANSSSSSNSTPVSPYVTTNSVKSSDILTDTNKASAKSIIGTLDDMLAGLLAESSLNGYNLDSTANILTALASFGSNYLGSGNTNALLKLVNTYMGYLNCEDFNSTTKNPNANGDVDPNKLYTSEHLSNLVIQTYSLLEDIISYVITDTAKIKDYTVNGKNYNLLTEALSGIISPDTVATRVINDKTALSYKSYEKDVLGRDSWKDVKSITFDFKAGDKASFYKGIAESLRLVTSILSVVFIDAGYYDSLVQPVLAALVEKQSAAVKNSVYAVGTVKTADDVLFCLLNPISALLSDFYKKPVTVLLQLVPGLAKILDNTTTPNIAGIVTAATAPLKGEIVGLGNIVNYATPTGAKKIYELTAKLNVDVSNFDLVSTLNGALKKLGIVLGPINWNALANSASTEETLLRIVAYLINTITDDDNLNAIIVLAKLTGKQNVIDLFQMLAQLDAKKILNILNEVLALTDEPTLVYWTFSQYVTEAVTGFKYPLGVSKSDAENAIGQLDSLVANIFPLLSGFGLDVADNLPEIVNDNLYTNKLLTTIAVSLYAALEGEVGTYLGYVGIATSTDDVAKLLTDRSYGKTFSSAAKTIKAAKSWKALKKAVEAKKNPKTINWGFKDGSKNAKQGFLNGLAAILRPLNSVLTFVLAGDGLELGNMLSGLVSGLTIKETATQFNKDNENGGTLKYSLKKGILTLKIKSNNKSVTGAAMGWNEIKLDLNAVVKQIKDLELYGGNAYENSVVPLLEAFKCTGLKTYAQYTADIEKAKDNVLLDVLNPLFGFVDELLEAPFDTITGVLPNVAYFIDNNGVSQLLNNLLAPITQLLPVLKENGLDVEKIIECFLGTSINQAITKLLGVNIHLDLNDLNKCDIQNAVIPLVNKLLKNYKIKLPKIDWGTLAGHGTVKTVKSAALNAEGTYTTKQVTARQGETLIAVLRYILDAVIDNMSAIKKLVSGIKMDKKIKDILNPVFTQLGATTSDDVIRAIFYLLTEEPTNAFWDYTDYKTKSYDFTYPEGIEDFCVNLGPTVDGLISGIISGGLAGLVEKNVYKDSIINTIAKALYQALQGVDLGSMGSLVDLLAMTDINFTTQNVAKLLTDKNYGKTYEQAAKVIAAQKTWDKVNFDNISWGVNDRDSFLNALCAILRPVYGVLDVLFNGGSLGLFKLIYLPGSNGYTNSVVPLMEALSLYNIKTQYQYREDISKAYDNILLDILNPLFDFVEDLLNAPLQTLSDKIPNLALFIANNGLLQLIDNLVTPITALLDALKPVIDLNELLPQILKALNVDLKGFKIDLYHISNMVEPYIGQDKIVDSLNSLLASIKIGGAPLNLKLLPIDWFQLASHGDVKISASMAATYGSRVYVEANAAETLIAVLRYLIATIQSGDNLTVISNLISGLLGDADESVTGIIDTVLGMLMDYKGDDLIAQIGDLLETLAG